MIQESLVLQEKNIGSQSQSFGNTMINYQRESLCTHVSVFVSLFQHICLSILFSICTTFLSLFYKYVCDSSWFCVCVSFFRACPCEWVHLCVFVCLSVFLCADSDSCGSRVWHSWCHQLTGAAPPGMNTASASLASLASRASLASLHHCVTCITLLLAKGCIRIPSLHHLHQTLLICLEGLASLHHF